MRDWAGFGEGKECRLTLAAKGGSDLQLQRSVGIGSFGLGRAIRFFMCTVAHEGVVQGEGRAQVCAQRVEVADNGESGSRKG